VHKEDVRFGAGVNNMMKEMKEAIKATEKARLEEIETARESAEAEMKRARRRSRKTCRMTRACIRRLPSS
jgi:vacuolar-type H+-ATPase subunit H